jgi:redox-sensitive bicupin YhaK (pirin superfamily)
MTVDVRRANERFATNIGWLDSHHSFSFGSHRDPNNTHHGLLLVNNDDTHAHRDMEIVTWVLSGELEHKDSAGHHGLLYPGLAQRMSAGTGIQHSEKNPSAEYDVHFVQMWVLPDTNGIAPEYEQLDLNTELDAGGLVPIASGKGHSPAITIHQAGAVLWGGRLRADERVTVPVDVHVHVFVARGTADLDMSESDAQYRDPIHLLTGDAVRLTNAGSPDLIAGPEGAEVLIWATS